MLQALLCVFILIRGVSEKKYRFAVVSVLVVLHAMSVALNTYNNIVYKDILKATEIAVLIVLFVVLIYCVWREKRKHDIIPVVFAGLACGIRILRSAVYDVYVDAATQPGANTAAIIGELNDNYNLLNGIIGLCIWVVLACVAWKLRKK